MVPDSPRDREQAWASAHATEVPGGRVIGGLVRAYLAAMHALAAPLVSRGVPPSAVTLAAVLLSWLAVAPALAGGRWALASVVVLAVGGLADSLDGQVARDAGRSSRLGALADAVGDRLSDLATIGVLWALGAPAAWVLLAAGAGFLQEYARARAQVEGVSGPGVVSVSERPTRVAVVVMFTLGAGLYPGAAVGWATTGAVVAAALALVALAQVLVALVRQLSRSAPETPRS